MKGRMRAETRLSENPNPNNLDYSRIIQFSEDSGTHSDTQVVDGRLGVVDGVSNGRWISDIIRLESQISEIEVRMVGENLVKQHGSTTSNLWFSLDGGTTWRLNPEEGSTAFVPVGRDLRFRIDLNDSDATVKAVGALYSY
jgi:hypothetical protein